MPRGDNYYKQTIPELNLSIEKGTENVPEAKQFYVLQGGKILGTFRLLKQAQELFQEIVQKSGYKPKMEAKGKTPAEVAAERYLEAKDLYWAESYKYRGGGGKGGRGGV